MSEKDDSISPSSVPIFRHTDGEKERETPHAQACNEEITAHIEQHIGEVEIVFHEIASDTVHIDVHHVKPTQDRPLHTLVTSGMSDLSMNVPEDVDSPTYMELMVTLPMNWQINEIAFKEEPWYWPIRQLKYLARFPHNDDSWLGWGHTIPNGDPPEPFADNVPFNGVIILPPISVSEEFYTLPIDEEKEISFYSYIPLYEEEIELTLKKGTDELLDKFDRYGITDIVDSKRRNVAKKTFGVF